MEWNAGAFTLIFLLFITPAILIYLLVGEVIKSIPVLSISMVKVKKERPYIYIMIHIGLVVLSVGLAYEVLSLIYSIRGKGLLE